MIWSSSGFVLRESLRGWKKSAFGHGCGAFQRCMKAPQKQRRSRNSTALRYAAKIVENAVKWNCKRVFASMYQTALAVRVCFMHADNGAVSAELSQVSDKFKNNEVDAILQEHAVWCGTQIESIDEGVADANSDFLLRAEQVVRVWAL